MHFMHPFDAAQAASENASRATALPLEKFWWQEGGPFTFNQSLELPSIERFQGFRVYLGHGSTLS
jgi:hypothetical protein